MRELIRIVRTGAITEWASAARHVACVMGSAANMASGDSGPYGSVESERSLQEICDELDWMEQSDGYAGLTEAYLSSVLMELVQKFLAWMFGK